MSDPFRSGGFGTPGFGPFQTGGGGDSRYLIGNDGNNVASMRRYSAQVAWANGTITDAAYLEAMRKYVGTTTKGSRERVSSQNEYEDAVYTVGRNKLVRDVNNATSANLRTSSLRRLISYDSKKLATMKPDNEQYRELKDRITSSRGQVLDVRWGDLVRRFNRNQVSTAAMISFARNAAAASAGSPDQATWQDRTVEWQGRADTEKINGLYQDYQQQRIPGSTVIAALQQKLSGMDPSSPAYAETQRSIEDLTKQITSKAHADRDNKMAAALDHGDITDNEYLHYLKGRIKDYPAGSADRRSASDAFLSATYSMGEKAIYRGIDAGTATSADLVDFYRGYMATMDPGASKYLDMAQKVSDLLVGGTSALALWSRQTGPGGGGGVGGYAGGGHYIDMSGAPGGTPVGPGGFASQFDGTAFASQNCGMASAAMLAWAASGGKVKVSGGDLRYYSGDRDAKGDEIGTTYDDVARAFDQVGLGLVQQHGMAFESWKRRLARGEGSLISGWYGDVPQNLQLTNGSSFTHTMYVDQAKKFADGWYFYVMDPLGRSGQSGRWWPEAAMRQFGWSNTANNTGQWFGDVAFAGKQGRSATYITPDRGHPTYQAFDTDYNGNSTVGRGGGTSRAEAGPHQDWSNGRPKHGADWHPKKDDPKPTPETTGGTADPTTPAVKKVTITDTMVSEFLAAVDASKRPGPGDLSPSNLFPQAQTANDREGRARTVLIANGGDARLAAVAWFTQGGTDSTFKANPDTTTWGSTERFYANAVGTRLGYEPVTRGQTTTTASGPLTRGATGTITPQAPPTGFIVSSARPVDQQAGAKLDGVAPEAQDIATKLLTKLGVAATPDMVRAIVAWMSTEGSKVNGNNPLVLRTVGVRDLPGQLTKDANGLAVFGTMDDGIAAAAAEIKRSFPGLIPAMRSNDPERFLVTLDRSGWVQGGYAGTLIKTFNEMPGGDQTIIGGAGRLLDTPADLASLARREPRLADLFDIDPRDPAQMAWLDANVASAKRAQDSGAATWTFTTPGGDPVELDFNPSMATELLGTKALYLDWNAEVIKHSANREDYGKALAKAAAAHADRDANGSSVAYDQFQARWDALDNVRQNALGGGDIATYLNATKEMVGSINTLLGMPVDAPLDINTASLITLFPSHKDALSSLIDSLAPMNQDNPSGDRIRGLVEAGAVIPTYDANGNATKVDLPPDKAFIKFEPGSASTPPNLAIHTFLDHANEFVLADIPTETLGGQPSQQPTYMQGLGFMVMPDGTAAYVDKGSGYLTGWVLDAAGARTIPAPVPPPAPGVSPGSIGFRASGRADRLAGQPGYIGDTAGQSGGQFNVSPWTMQGNPRPGSITSATRQDMQVVRVPGVPQVPVQMMTVVWNSKQYTMHSLGDGQWFGGEQSQLDLSAPRLVLSKESGALVVNGALTVGGKPYDPATNGPMTKFFHLYGTRPEDGAGMNLGAEHGHLKVRDEQVGPYGSRGIDLTAPDVRTGFLEGDVSWDVFLASAQQRAPDKGGLQGGSRSSGRFDAPAAGGGLGDVNRSSGRFAPAAGSSTLAGVDFSQFEGSTGSPITDSQLSLIDQLPVTAGASPAPRAMTRTNSMFNLSDRLSMSVQTGANAVLSSANAQRSAAAAQAATQERLARIAAGQAAANARAKAAQVRTYDVPTTRPSLGITNMKGNTPKPRPMPSPDLKGPQGSPTPTPTPTPKPVATPQQRGNY